MHANKQHPKLAQVRAILAKAEDPAASPEEAQAYFAKAADLMSKYGIERAMLAETEPETDRPAQRIVIEKGSYLLDRVNLLMSVVEALGGQSCRRRIYDWETGKYVQRVEIHGYESVLDRAEMLYTSLLLQAFNGMKKGRPQPGETTTAYRKTWLSGFRATVTQRLRVAEQAAVEDADRQLGSRSAELVVAKREDTIRAIFKAAHPTLRTPQKRHLTGSGWHEGAEAGKRADLGNPRVGSGRRHAVAA
ncbi:DUF2786 domain-containing protein [Streptomyces sp. VNUA116]|uniref:DUF2786 domain-containing protein n=1 Tax=Streptomyces sp. VNUA116 TaxID=3062449 RepID=UPI0026758FA1|nr:DUF2786 domain-containing protein [Streptomyces sp. VNUA116]WKU46766.1 DUF2786 domain-containing protein [Streptomyces sp. VNUA116]